MHIFLAQIMGAKIGIKNRTVLNHRLNNLYVIVNKASNQKNRQDAIVLRFDLL